MVAISQLRREASGEMQPPDTLISDISPPNRERIHFCDLGCPACCLLAAAPAGQGSSRRGPAWHPQLPLCSPTPSSDLHSHFSCSYDSLFSWSPPPLDSESWREAAMIQSASLGSLGEVPLGIFVATLLKIWSFICLVIPNIFIEGLICANTSLFI